MFSLHLEILISMILILLNHLHVLHYTCTACIEAQRQQQRWRQQKIHTLPRKRIYKLNPQLCQLSLSLSLQCDRTVQCPISGFGYSQQARGIRIVISWSEKAMRAGVRTMARKRAEGISQRPQYYGWVTIYDPLIPTSACSQVPCDPIFNKEVPFLLSLHRSAAHIHWYHPYRCGRYRQSSYHGNL